MASILRSDHFGIATFHHSVPGTSGDAVCTLGFGCNSDDGQAVADKASQAWATHIMPVMDGNAVFHGCTTLQHIGGQLESWISHVADPSPGSGGNFCFPANVAVLVQKRTGLAGRKNRGRFYLPGVAKAIVTSAADPNTMSEAKRVEYQTALDALYTDLTSESSPDNITPMIIHPLPNPVQGTIITSFSVQARLATQRNRLRD